MKGIVKGVVEEAEKLVKSIPGEAVKQIVGDKEDKSSETGGQQKTGSGAGQKQQKQRDDAYLQLAKADDRQKTTAEISYLEREMAELRRRQTEQTGKPDKVEERKMKEEQTKMAKAKLWWQKQKEAVLQVRRKQTQVEGWRGRGG